MESIGFRVTFRILLEAWFQEVVGDSCILFVATESRQWIEIDWCSPPLCRKWLSRDGFGPAAARSGRYVEGVGLGRVPVRAGRLDRLGPEDAWRVQERWIEVGSAAHSPACRCSSTHPPHGVARAPPCRASSRRSCTEP